MAVMQIDNRLTREDLDALPDDGLRHELIDGAFVMTPSPNVRHQELSAGLFLTLRSALRHTELQVLYAPFDVVLGSNVVVPDLLVARRSDFTDRSLPVAPLLVVEIRSPSTAWLDEGRKRSIYEEAGVSSYWLADPIAPAITILELDDGHYVEVARAVGDQAITVTKPVPVTLNPDELARG
jgi:Uma2 family endonuclease